MSFAPPLPTHTQTAAATGAYDDDSDESTELIVQDVPDTRFPFFRSNKPLLLRSSPLGLP